MNLAVTGTNTWVVTITLNGSQTLQSSWQATVTGSGQTLTATTERQRQQLRHHGLAQRQQHPAHRDLPVG